MPPNSATTSTTAPVVPITESGKSSDLASSGRLTFGIVMVNPARPITSPSDVLWAYGSQNVSKSARDPSEIYEIHF